MKSENLISKSLRESNLFPFVHKLQNLGFSKTPFDYVAMDDNGNFFAFEVKEVLNKKSISFNRLEDHQKHYLKTIAENGGKAFVVILFTRFKKYFFIEIREWLKIEEKSVRKSVKYTDLEERWETQPTPKKRGVLFLEELWCN